MGVDYYTCHYCHSTFPDCGPYIACEDCGRKWCPTEYGQDCGKQEGLVDMTDRCALEDCEDVDHPYGDNCSNEDCYGYRCMFCRNEAVDDGELLEYLLSRFDLTRDKAEEDCLKFRELDND